MSYRNILIVKLSAIGDVIHALPVAHALKSCYPEARLTWVVERAAFDILKCNQYVDEIIVFDKPRFKSISGVIHNAPAFIQELRSRHFDLALDLQGLFKSGIIAYLSGAPERLVYCNAREGSNLFSRQVGQPSRDRHIVDLYLDTVRALGCPVDEVKFGIYVPDEDKIWNRLAAGIQPTGHQPIAVLVPGANWPNKRWPAASFAELAKRLAADGLIPVIVGGPGDSAAADAIIELSGGVARSLVGKTSLPELAVVIHHASVLIGGDTGPMHLGAAVGTPVVALLGPTNPERNGPFGKANISLLTAETCTGCWRRECPKGLDCLASITPSRVVGAVKEVMLHA